MFVKRITSAGKQDVYNMEVKETHSFAVENGAVAHNCYDETRYFLMARYSPARVEVDTRPVEMFPYGRIG